MKSSKKKFTENYNNSKELGKILFKIHTHADLCDPDEIVYKEKDIIELLNYIGLQVKFEENE